MRIFTLLLAGIGSCLVTLAVCRGANEAVTSGKIPGDTAMGTATNGTHTCGGWQHPSAWLWRKLEYE